MLLHAFLLFLCPTPPLTSNNTQIVTSRLIQASLLASGRYESPKQIGGPGLSRGCGADVVGDDDGDGCGMVRVARERRAEEAGVAEQAADEVLLL